MQNSNLIPLNLTPARDDEGYWSNPGIPEFDEGEMDAYRDWLKQQGIEVEFSLLESEPMDHPAYVAYFDESACGCQLWTDEPPPGEGWNTFSIHDSEDGPVWVWARRIGDA